jgi:hypothetical protein
MGIIVVPVVALLFVLLVAHGADGSRSHPTGEEVKPKLTVNGTSSIRVLMDHVSPQQDSSSEAKVVYVSYSGPLYIYVRLLIPFSLPHRVNVDATLVFLVETAQ